MMNQVLPHIRPADNPAIEAMRAQFDALRPHLAGRDRGWLNHQREAALEAFASQGWPSVRHEAWKYTSLKALDSALYKPAGLVPCGVSIDTAPRLLPSNSGHCLLTFVNGQLRPDLGARVELPEGVELLTLADALQAWPDWMQAHLGRRAKPDGKALVDLNTALMNNGYVLRLRPGTQLHVPIEVLHLSAGAAHPVAVHTRNLIVLEAGSRATVIEHHHGLDDSASFVNAVTEVTLGPDSLFQHYKLQNEGPRTFHFSTGAAELDRGASYDSFTLSIGAQLSRNEVHVGLAGEGAECHLNGAYLMRGHQHCDTTTVIDHLVPHTSCRETFKGVVDDQARAVFQGRIVVHEGAQQTNGHQLSKVLLLSNEAEVDAKPELEIYADDVLCSHGATAGDLDAAALFYLRSRGIPEEQARAMLIEAFLAESIQSIAAEGLCPALMTSIGHWLADA